MNKKARVGLIALIATLLLLAITFPVLATSTTSTRCWIPWRAWSLDGTIYNVNIPGDLVSSWSGTTLTTTCTGDIPLGEPLGSSTYFDLEDVRWYLCTFFGACDLGTPLVFGSADGLPQHADITYQGIYYYSTNWSYRVLNNGYCEVTSVFTIP